jgi:hypothetical protein
MRKAGALFLLTAALACAQPVFEIRGTVTEPATNHALEGVDVTVLPGNGLPVPEDQMYRLKTDSNGSFRVVLAKAGQYVTRVRKNGYTRSGLRGISTDQAGAILSDEKPAAEFHFVLERAGEISGRVIDDETEAPLANLKIGLAPYVSENGQLRARGGIVTTNAEGGFRSDVIAGEYLIATVPQVSGKDHLLTRFSAEDVKSTDMDYRRTYFPGGPLVQTALPLPVPSGASANAGIIRIRKQPLYRVHVLLDSASCPSGAQLQLLDTIIELAATTSHGPIPCAPFLLTHVAPGAYELQLTAGAAGVAVRYTVAEQNLELPVALTRGATLPGMIVPAEGATDIPLSDFHISFSPITSIPSADVQPHAVDDRGRFEFSNIRPGLRRKVRVDGLGTEFYIRQVRYRGVAAPGEIIEFDGTGSLEIEIDRSPAALTGTVMNRDKAVANADVVFLRWPAAPEDDRDAVRHITADGEGRFRINGIVPGEYRIFAVTAEDRDASERPFAWQRLLTRAEKITLGRGASRDVTLQPDDPAR